MTSLMLEFTQGVQGPRGPVGAPGLKGDGYPGVPVSGTFFSSLPPSFLRVAYDKDAHSSLTMSSQGPRGLPGPPGPMGLRGVGDTGAKVRL